MQTHNGEQSHPEQEKPQRRYDIDWLRVLLMLAVFLFHCARFFGGGTWHLNNATESIAAMVFIGWLDMWFMPLFCLLSGVGSWYALKSRTNGQYVPADSRFTASIKKHGWICLALGLAGYGGEGFLVLGLGYKYPGDEAFSLMFVLFETIMTIGRWSWMVFVLSLGAKHLNVKHTLLAYANEAVLPFYLFHQTIILCVGWFVIPWNIGILPKYLIILAVSFALIIALYELLVRRSNVLRFFFGMRPKRD